MKSVQKSAKIRLFEYASLHFLNSIELNRIESEFAPSVITSEREILKIRISETKNKNEYETKTKRPRATSPPTSLAAAFAASGRRLGRQLRSKTALGWVFSTPPPPGPLSHPLGRLLRRRRPVFSRHAARRLRGSASHRLPPLGPPTSSPPASPKSCIYLDLIDPSRSPSIRSIPPSRSPSIRSIPPSCSHRFFNL